MHKHKSLHYHKTCIQNLNTTTTCSKDTHGYGVGQDVGDAAIHWIVFSDSLIMVYWSHTHKIINPKNKVIVAQGINAFIDNTTHINAASCMHPMSTKPLLDSTQENTNLWKRPLKPVEEPSIQLNVLGSLPMGE